MADAATTHHRDRSVVRDAMVRFTVLSCVCLVLLGLLNVIFAGTIARSMAAREAQARTSGFVRAFSGDLLLDAGTSAGLSASPMTQAVTNRIRDGSLRHAAIYDPNGLILWSAEPDKVGTTVDLDADVRGLVGRDGAIAHLTDTVHPAGRNPRGEVFLEVYTADEDANGQPFIMEWYWPTSELATNQDTLLARMLPLSVGSLLLFQLMVLPLTLSVARRVENDRTRLTKHVLNASRLERRRISEDLHDGVAQDLSAIGYVLPIIGRDVTDGSQGQDMLGHIREMVQRNISVVRGLIADNRPLDLRGGGFKEALDALPVRLRERGVEVAVSVVGDIDELSESARLLIYRVVREGLRNVVRHSGASRAWVVIEQQDSQVRVSVRDDGEGPGAAQERPPGPEGEDPHFGLDLLREALSDVGGSLDLRTRPEGGCELLVEFRLDLLAM